MSSLYMNINYYNTKILFDRKYKQTDKTTLNVKVYSQINIKLKSSLVDQCFISLLLVKAGGPGVVLRTK